MPTQTFTSGNDTFLVHTAGTFDLDFLEGDDTLTVQGGTSTTAHMGLGNDIVQLKSGLATVFGDAGADRFEIYAANAIVDGGDDNDLINIRGGSGISASGGLGDDRFNIYAGSLSLTLHGGDGDDDFFGYFHPVTGTIYGDAGNDYFVQFVGGVSIYGGTGNDIYRADATNPAAFVELSGEGIDSVQVARGASYTLPDNIENISVQGFHGSVLTAATLTGNALNNTINGHNNIETVVGLAGDDRLFAKGGDDTVWGGEGNDYLDGGPGNDTLNGEAGNDTINGRTGNDTMAGGTGDDTYYVDSLSDVVTENSGEGTDLVRVAISGYTLTDNVENGTVFGSAGISMSGNILDNLLTGGAGGDVLHAGSGNDTVKGGAGNDQLYGEAGDDILNGGAGDDSMFGGIGNDTYYVDSLSDSIVENDLQGSDSAYVTVSGYTLAANVESGFVGVTTALTLSGNAIGNHLTGNAGDDVLHGGDGADTLDGGTGADTMDGGLGDDTYYVDNPGDVVEEGIGDPPWSNTVYSAIVYYDLPDYVSFGYVTLTTGATLIGGNGFYALAGNLGDDTLTGGNLLYGMEGNDTLTGTSLDDNIDGGSGADTMTGGIGDDSYTVDNSADQIVENPGEGTYDTVYSFAADYTLSANVEYGDIEIESATLHGNGSANQLLGKTGGGNDVLDGLGGDDTLGGDAGNDTLYGGDGNDRLIGGLGADQMWGGAGNDTFFYASASYSTVAAPDMINDFTSGSDKIDVSGAYSGTFTWTLFPSGTAGQWWFSADASTPNLYHLFFDVDGGGADMKIDVLTTGGGIATTDIIG